MISEFVSEPDSDFFPQAGVQVLSRSLVVLLQQCSLVVLLLFFRFEELLLGAVVEAVRVCSPKGLLPLYTGSIKCSLLCRYPLLSLTPSTLYLLLG